MVFYNKSHNSSFLLSVMVVATVLLGNGQEVWSAGIIMVMTGIYILTTATGKSLGKAINILYLLLLTLPLLVFLPASWFPDQTWRQSAARDFHLPISTLLTPQPLLTLQNFILLVWGSLWIYHNASAPFTPGERYLLARQLSNVFLLVSSVAFALFLLQWNPEFWHSPKQFGFFANRNHTANFLAMGALLTLACSYEDFKGDFFRSCIFRLCGTLFLLYLLLALGSKAGVLLFLLGAVIWFIWLGAVAKNGQQICVGAAIVFSLLTLVFLAGGKTLERILCFHPTDGSYLQNLRWSLNKDSLEMMAQNSVFGVGLSNFPGLFPQFRSASISQGFALHPESDWMLAGVEMGIPSVLCMLAILVLVVRKIPPFIREKSYIIRIMAFLIVGLFFVHSWVDVPAHRMGTFLTAVLFLRMSLPIEVGSLEPVRLLLWIQRAVAGLLIVAGLVWAWTLISPDSIPSRHRLDALQQTAHLSIERGQELPAIESLTHGLRWAPLHWSLYFERAIAHGRLGHISQAEDDFRRARFLMPHQVSLRMAEGSFWLNIQPDSALVVWAEALKLSDRPDVIYNDMLQQSAHLPAIRQSLKWLANDQPDLFMIGVQHSSPTEYLQDIHRLIRENSDLNNFTAAQKQLLLSKWNQYGSKDEVALLLETQESLRGVCWPILANYYADHGAFKKAWELATRHGKAPLPYEMNTSKTLEEMKMNFAMNPENLDFGLLLLSKQLRGHSNEECLATIAAIKKIPNAPKYVWFYEGEIWAKKEAWEQAWKARTYFDQP